MQLGREALGAKAVPVYAMPRMKQYLETNGPWSQLVRLNNIDVKPLDTAAASQLAGNVKVQPFIVPHRDEYSETVGFAITAGNKKYIFIPDIDKWNKWGQSVISKVKAADVALLDGTFYNDVELPGRSMSEVPHPFIVETLALFANEDKTTICKIHFIHFNHTNPLLWDAKKQKEVRSKGFNIAVQGEQL
jgi:pyrroloquinoline quinone biosynthesis protein B